MIKKLLISLLTATFLITLGVTIVNVAHAAGSATVSFGGSTTVANGQNVAVSVSVSNISGTAGGGIGNIQGTFVWDPNYFQYVSFSSGVAWPITFNSANGKYYGVDGSGSPIAGNTTLFTVTLKALQAGTSNVSLSGNAMGDGLAGIVSLTNPSARSITITAPATLSDNNFLSALSVSGYTIGPSFNRSTNSYTLTVPNSASSVTVNATREDSTASVTGAGAHSLNVGNNTVNIVVTAQNGATRTYTINIVRESSPTPTATKSSDATLKSLNVSGYTLTPSFNKNTTNYSITVKKGINGLNVTALANDPKATVVVTGNTGWNDGTNNIMIRVTAEDGTVKTYIVTVHRPGESVKSSNSYLKSLTVKDYPINFNKSTNSYAITVPYEIDKLDLSAIVEDSKAKVEIIGNKDFKVGAVNVVEIKVTAEDGSIRIYTINVTRSASVSHNKLTDLSVKDHKINPKFDPDVEEYSLTVPHSVTNLDVLYKTQDKHAKVKITGDKNLKVGNNVILVKVTDANGFVRTYIINVERESWKIFGLSPYWLFGILGLLLLLLLLIILFKRRKKDEEVDEEEPVEPPVQTPNTININVSPSFTPDVNIGSKNDSDFVSDQGQLTQGSSNSFDADDKQKLIDAVEADVVDTSAQEQEDYDIDELMTAINNKDQDKLSMYIRQIKANDLKDELKGLDPDRFDDIFDDDVTVHEVVKAMEKWNDTHDSKELNMLMNQYAATKLKDKLAKRSEKGKK